jgi:hypothetical protein
MEAAGYVRLPAGVAGYAIGTALLQRALQVAALMEPSGDVVVAPLGAVIHVPDRRPLSVRAPQTHLLDTLPHTARLFSDAVDLALVEQVARQGQLVRRALGGAFLLAGLFRLVFHA